MAVSEGKWAFIINPVAGNGFAKKHLDEIKNKIKESGVEAETAMTERKGHAVELAANFADKGFQNIIAVGGDGTVNEIVRSIIDRDITLGVVPAGTGNDFVQIPGFKGYFNEDDWNVFFNKNTIKMDVGRCNGNYFLNGMGLGFDAQVAAENYSDSDEVKSGSASKYLWHIIKTLLFFKEKQMYSLINGDKEQTKCFINTISIGRRFAGGFFLTPKAVANDGLLDVCMIKELTFPGRVKIFLKVPKGTHINDENVNYYQTDKLSLEFDNEVPYHLDGELFFASQFEVDILPKKLNLIYNPGGDHFFDI